MQWSQLKHNSANCYLYRIVNSNTDWMQNNRQQFVNNTAWNPKDNCTSHKMAIIRDTGNKSWSKERLGYNPKGWCPLKKPFCRTSGPLPCKENKLILLMISIWRWGRRWSMIELMSQKVFTFGYHTSSTHNGLTQVLQESRPVLLKRKTWLQHKMLVSFHETYL